MKPDYAKAAAELIERLKLQAGAATQPPPPFLHADSEQPSTTVIYAPRDCTINITNNTSRTPRGDTPRPPPSTRNS